jgi:hypothetical protein
MTAPITPATVPARTVARRAKPVRKSAAGPNVIQYSTAKSAFKAAQAQARLAVGYDKDSKIWGRLELDVLGDISQSISLGNLDEAQELTQELLKRHTANKLAGDTYRATV